MDKSDIERAAYMLRVAARYIAETDPEGEVEYDETTCDGHCVADDCETAADALSESES